MTRREMVRFNDLGRSEPEFARTLQAVVLDVVRSGRYLFGPKTEAFEHEFASLMGCQYGIGVGSGTDALELALRALDIGPGDEIITVANAGGYSSLATLTVGARPVYVDVVGDTMSMDASQLEGAITHRTRAIIVTHLYGYPADLAAILPIAESAGLALIEDCAQAHGAVWSGRPVGSFGLLSCFSFYPTKNLGAFGDAGIVLTCDPRLSDRLRRLRQYGWHNKYCSVEYGRNSRLDELQAAVLLAKLPYLEPRNRLRRAIVRRYAENCPACLKPPPLDDSSAAHLAVVRSANREAWRDALAKALVATDVHYPIPDHRQPWASECQSALPMTERLCTEVFSLPCYPEMTTAELDQVCTALQNAESLS